MIKIMLALIAILGVASSLIAVLAIAQKPVVSPNCPSALVAKGHDEAVAIQNFQKASMPTVTGMTPAHEMFQAAADFLRIEKFCKLGGKTQ